MSVRSDSLLTLAQYSQDYSNNFQQDTQVQFSKLSFAGKSDINDQSTKANFGMSVITIVKISIGSGILALPYTISHCGVIFAAIVFVIATAMSQFSSNLLLKSKNLSGHSNFYSILSQIHPGKSSIILGSIFIFLGNLGVCIAEIIIFKKTMRKMITDFVAIDSPTLSQFYTSQIFLALIASMLQLPFILTRKIQYLRKYALVGVIGILVFILAFIIHFAHQYQIGNCSANIQLFPSNWYQAFSAIPNIIYALTFFGSFFPIYKGMRYSSDQRMKKASLVALLICSAIYFLIGVMGYYLLGHNVQGNLLQSLQYDKANPILYCFLNLGFLLSVCLTFPIMFFGCRNHFISLLKGFITEQKQKQQEIQILFENNETIDTNETFIDKMDQERRKNDKLFRLKAFVVYSIIFIVGISVDDITIVFNAVGAICSSSIAFLLPCIFYVMLIEGRRKSRKATFYIAVIVFVGMVPFSLFTVIAKYLPN